MGFKESYKNVLDKVKAAIESIPSLKRINIGEAARVSELPMAIVIPRETRIARTPLPHTLECRLTFDIIIVIRETEPESWLKNIIEPMGDVLEALLSDDTLSGAVKSLTPTLFSPGEITAQNKLYYGGLIRFEAAILHQY